MLVVNERFAFLALSALVCSHVYFAHSRLGDEGCVAHLCDPLVSTLADFTAELMRLEWPIIKKIAEALLNQKALTYRQVHDIKIDPSSFLLVVCG